jgi:hypothetical protein
VHGLPVLVQEKTVAVVKDARAYSGTPPPEQELERRVEGGARRRRGTREEAVSHLAEEVDEYAAERARRKEVRDREQQPAGVDHAAPAPADGTAHGEVPRREAAEDLREQLVREAFHGKGGAVLRRMWFRDFDRRSIGVLIRSGGGARVEPRVPVGLAAPDPSLYKAKPQTQSRVDFRARQEAEPRSISVAWKVLTAHALLLELISYSSRLSIPAAEKIWVITRRI